MIKLIWAFLLAIPLIAENVPNRFIVTLTTEPVAQHVRAQGRFAIHGIAAERHRVRLRAEQAEARSRVGQAEGVVTGAIENVQNALVVEIESARAGRLASIPGVRKVYPVRTFHPMLDHALPLHRVPAAWTQVGIQNAGAGVRIAIIDSGVDVKHPGFNDGGFTAPQDFPRGDLAHTNNKVIVARSYVAFLPRQDPDRSAADHVGHGTATAMAAAGVTSVGPLATISGVAPRAYIGSYKVFGSPSVNSSTTDDVILRAIDDAVADGMGVINLSLGTDLAYRLEDDLGMQALENAAALGIVVVCSAGNNGPDPMTIGSPAAAPSVIAVGATANDRIFSSRVLASGGQQFRGIPGAASSLAQSVAGRLVDVSAFDPEGLACNPLPAGSLTGAVALISRGTCNFEYKLNNAQAAGARAALVYNNVAGAPITMGVGAATLSAQMVAKEDGATLRTQASAGIEVTLEFTPGPMSIDASRLETFSAAGPHLDLGIKPDLVAVGANLYTAAQSLDFLGSLYSASGFAVEQGTSFSAPIVAGAAAVLKSARPGLTGAQYRSLLVNTASDAWSSAGIPAHVQRGGAGSLDLLSAVSSTAAAAPVSLSFGSSRGTVFQSRSLTVWNVGSTRDTFRLSVLARGGNAVPELPVASIDLEPGASATVPVNFSASGLAPGEYDGFVEIQGSRSTLVSRVPYWHGVSSREARYITLIQTRASGRPGSSSNLVFRVTDEAGVPYSTSLPFIRVLGGGGTAGRPTVLDGALAYGSTLTLGTLPGSNVFRIQVGDLTKDVTVIGQ
jgi:subtilisin family serine protease